MVANHESPKDLHPEQIVRVQEEERRHIARELHDEIGQLLTAAVLNLQFFGAEPVPPDARDEVVVELKQALARVRDLSLNLRPPLLDEAGLGPALRWYVERQSAAGRIPVTLVFEDGSRAAGDIEITAFRIVQEATTNALKHARAERIEVRAAFSGERLVIEVSDDGRGFDVAAALSAAVDGASLGVLALAERARLVGGECRIASTPGQGTRVRAELPIRMR